jgi:hypothetical protein
VNGTDWVRVWTVLALVVAIGACAGTDEDDARGATGRYVFDVYEENFSWGYTLRGFYVDRNGDVWSYDHSDERWIPGDGAVRLTEADLKEKFDNGRKVLTLGAGAVRDKLRLINSASRGGISRFSQSRDRGRYAWVAYQYDPDRRNYRVVVLGADGDWIETNSTSAAQELVAWLKEVKQRVSATQ